MLLEPFFRKLRKQPDIKRLGSKAESTRIPPPVRQGSNKSGQSFSQASAPGAKEATAKGWRLVRG